MCGKRGCCERVGGWLLIEDIDRAPQEVVAILTPLVQEGILTIHVLGGRSGLLQLFLTQREQVGSVREKLVRTMIFTSLRQEEIKTMIRTRFTKLEGNHNQQPHQAAVGRDSLPGCCGCILQVHP